MIKTYTTIAAAVALTAGSANAAVISNFDFDPVYTIANDADQANSTSMTFRLDDSGWGTSGGTGGPLAGSGWTITSVDFIHETSATDVIGLSISDGGQTIFSDNTIDQGTLSFGNLMAFTFSGDTETFSSSDTLTVSFTGGSGRTAMAGGGDRGGALDNLNTGSTNWHASNDLAVRITATAVPEPSSTALLGLGGLALILRRRK